MDDLYAQIKKICTKNKSEKRNGKIIARENHNRNFNGKTFKCISVCASHKQRSNFHITSIF